MIKYQSFMDCVFCKIIKKEIAADIVFENQDVLIFKDIQPAAPIHYLVVPKEHIRSITHLVDDRHRPIVADLIFLAKKAAEKAGLEGYKLVFNVGKKGGQVVEHVHLHILGGWADERQINMMNKKLSEDPCR